MTAGANELAAEIDALRDEIRRAGRDPWVVGTVVAGDSTTQTADVQIATTSGLRTIPGIGALGNYIPEAGHQVIVLMAGAAPIVIPPAQPLTSAAPAQVTGVTVTPSIGGLLVQWAALTEADMKWNRGYYQVDVATNAGFTTGLKTVDAAGTAAVVSGLTTGTTYHVRVRAIDYVGQPGTYSSTVTGVPIAIGTIDLGPGVGGVPIVGALPGLPNGTYPVGSVVSLTTDGKLYRNVANVWTAAVPTVDLTGTITNAQLAALSVSTAKIQLDAIDATLIAAGAVGSTELAAGAVVAGKITAGSIVSADIAALTIVAGNIAASTITGAKIAATTIAAGNIVSGTITSNEIATNTITANNILGSTITGAKIAATTITAANIAALTITANEIAANTITGGKIAANTITAGNIVAGTITATELAANSVTATQLAALNLTVGKFIGSTSYVSGVSGWQINADGTAEFNNVIVRGRADLSAGTEIFAVNTQGLETNTAGWVAQTTATTYQLDASITNWTGSSATVTFESTVYYNPPGGLRAVATAGTYEVRSPTGANKVATTAGAKHRVVLPVLAGTTTPGRTMTPCIRWWNGANVQVGADVTGTPVTTDSAVWRFGQVEAIAPATTAGLSIVYKFSGGASGDEHYIDEVAITSPANSTISRDTAQKRTGAASLKVTSIAAGLALAGTPDTGDGTGYSVVEGDYYYFRMYYRGSFAPIIVPAWLDSSGVLVKAGISPESFAAMGDTTFKLYNAVWQAPPGATRLSVALGFFASAGAQAMHFDDFSLTKMSTMQGGVWRSPQEVGSTAQSATEMSVFLRSSDTGFPYMQANGHVFARSLHARLRRTAVADANVPQTLLVPTRIAMDVVDENNGMTCLANGTTTGSYIIVPRTGYYHVTGKLTWKNWLAGGGTTGGDTVEVWAESASGTPLRLLAAQGGAEDGAAAGFSYNSAATDTARVNKGERVVLYGRTGLTGGHGVTTGQTSLQATYVGDAV